MTYKTVYNELHEEVRVQVYKDGEFWTDFVLEPWRVKDMIKVARKAMKTYDAMTGRQLEVLQDMEKYGIVRRPSYTQTEWTNEGVEALFAKDYK